MKSDVDIDNIINPQIDEINKAIEKMYGGKIKELVYKLFAIGDYELGHILSRLTPYNINVIKEDLKSRGYRLEITHPELSFNSIETQSEEAYKVTVRHEGKIRLWKLSLEV